MVRKYRIISGYSHLDLHPECWTPRVPAKWRDRAPRQVKLRTGDGMVIIENRQPHTGGHAHITAMSYGQRCSGPGISEGPGERRLREQDQEGVDAEILYTDLYSPVFLAMVASQDGEDAEIMYTHPVYSGFWRGVRDDEGYRALIRAYNEFLAEEYCPANPNRLIAMGVIPDTSVDDAITEMEYCTRAGLKGVALQRFPSGKGYPTGEDDRFWQASLDMHVPITFHAPGGGTRLRRVGSLVQDPHRRDDSPGERDPVSLLPRIAGDHPGGALQMAYAGVFDRVPRLRIYWAGLQARLLPYSLHRLDDEYERNRNRAEFFRGTDPLAHQPSYYLTTHCLWGLLNNAHAVRMRHDIGVGRLMWGSDFGGVRDAWHQSRDAIDRCFAGVPEDERYRLLAGNVIEFFHLGDEVIESAPTAPVVLAG